MINRILISFCLLAFFAAMPLASYAGNDKIKIDKEIKNQAKSLKKEGWQVMSGAKSLELQLMDSRDYSMMEWPEQDSIDKRYIVENATAKSGTLDMALMTARAQAMALVASMMEAEVSAFIESRIESLGAVGLDSSFSAETEMTAQEVLNSDVITALEIYRVCSDGNYEVRINLALDKALIFK